MMSDMRDRINKANSNSKDILKVRTDLEFSYKHGFGYFFDYMGPEKEIHPRKPNPDTEYDYVFYMKNNDTYKIVDYSRYVLPERMLPFDYLFVHYLFSGIKGLRYELL